MCLCDHAHSALRLALGSIWGHFVQSQILNRRCRFVQPTTGIDLAQLLVAHGRPCRPLAAFRQAPHIRFNKGRRPKPLARPKGPRKDPIGHLSSEMQVDGRTKDRQPGRFHPLMALNRPGVFHREIEKAARRGPRSVRAEECLRYGGILLRRSSRVPGAPALMNSRRVRTYAERSGCRDLARDLYFSSAHRA